MATKAARTAIVALIDVSGMAALLVGGVGARLSPADVHAVATRRVQAKLDAASRARMKPDGGRGAENDQDGPTKTDVELALSAKEIRAAALVLLWKAAQGSVRISAEDADRLEACTHSDEETLNKLAKDVAEVGLVKALLPTADARFGSNDEAVACLAVAALAAHQARASLRLADAVAALSAEALRATIETANVEEPTSSATGFRAYIDGSKRVKIARKGSLLGNMRGVVMAGRVHAALKDATHCLEQSVKTELVDAAEDGTAIACACTSVLAPAVAAFDCSLERFNAIGNATAVEHRPSVTIPPSSSFQAARMASDAAHALSLALAKEGASAYRLLYSEARAAERAEEARLKEGKKPKKKKAQGSDLGKGTALFYNYLDNCTTNLGMESMNLNNGNPKVEGAQFPLEHVLDATGARLNQELSAIQTLLESNQGRRKPKIPKGTRDFMPEQMAIREKAFAKIVAVFKRHGAVCIDTPVFELRETLMGKYGEDSKLIYDLADQGGEILSLRYDLTVPFARYVALHNAGNIKRYHIARVYRRDNPAMNRGRFREFFQCDFDIAGSYATMVPDAEVLKVIVEILSDLEIGDFVIKLNHRKLLDACMEIAGVPAQKFRTICSAIDKLDKSPWSEVKLEMTEQKGLPDAVADRVGEFVQFQGKPFELLEVLEGSSSPFAGHESSSATFHELRLLFNYLNAMGALDRIHFDLSLARGLDYYTGVIYEAVFCGESQVGSIAAGGRYDNLVGMFSGKDVPAVGVSLGIERVFAIKEEQERRKAQTEGTKVRSNETEVLVASVGSGLLTERMKIAGELWEAGIKAEFGFKPNPKMGDQLNFCLDNYIPFMVLVGETELQDGVIKIKNLSEREESTVPRNEMVAALRQLLRKSAEETVPVMCA